MTQEPSLSPQEHPELVIGLVAPVGVDFETFSARVEDALKIVGYESKFIHLTEYMETVAQNLNLTEIMPDESSNEEHLDAKIRRLMSAGNQFRRLTKDQSAFGALAVSTIYSIRKRDKEEGEETLSKTAYIVRQLKRPEEISLLREVYGRHFIQISAYCDRDQRVENLAHKISESSQGLRRADQCRPDAEALVLSDEEEAAEHYGQRLRDAFALADVIIDLTNPKKSDGNIERFAKAFFGNNGITPTRQEYGMFAARSASLRSSDLSRQVGASIALASGEIIATGCNEVPSAGGGTYWTDDPKDARDFRIGRDSNFQLKKDMISDILRRLKNAGWIDEKVSNISINEITDKAISKKRNPNTMEHEGPLTDSLLMDVLEFGRMLHAEMCAITDAARLGRPLDSATMYCTTFPCHMCAKHIVASGIERVVFVEPYPKSYAKDLHRDSIARDGDSSSKELVQFIPFVGIAPNRYAEIFTRGRRKDEYGTATEWKDGRPRPLIAGSYPSYLLAESPVIEKLVDALTDYTEPAAR